MYMSMLDDIRTAFLKYEQSLGDEKSINHLLEALDLHCLNERKHQQFRLRDLA